MRPFPRTSDLPVRLAAASPYFVHGCEGGEAAQAGLLDALLRHAGADRLMLAAAQGLLAWMQQQRPLSPLAASLAAGLHAKAPFLTPEAARLAAGVSALAQPAAEAPIEILSEPALAARHLPALIADPACGLAALGQAWEPLLLLGDASLAQAALDAAPWPRDLAPLRARLAAEAAFHLRGGHEARALAEALCPDAFPLWRGYALGELAARAGDTPGALRHLEPLWAAMPWHTNLTLKLSTLRTTPPSTPDAAGLAAVGIYTWNKAGADGRGPLRATLESLAASELCGAHVLVLDNGSTDATPHILAEAAALFPQGRYTVITLPVNVGAPPARNWLLSRPEAHAARWFAFLDDDIVLPPDWLPTLLAHGEADPAAGSVGCKIVEAAPPRATQSADFHLLPPGRAGGSSFRDLQEHVFVHENCGRGPDLGLFDYLRPCLHVSGCCHLVRMSGVAAAGAFDVRFNPSQFDDLERDLRQARHGLHSLYAGTVAVRHMQHSSLAKAGSAAATAQVFGNKIKLEHLFDGAQAQALAAQDHRRMAEHLAAAYAGMHAAIAG